MCDSGKLRGLPTALNNVGFKHNFKVHLYLLKILVRKVMKVFSSEEPLQKTTGSVFDCNVFIALKYFVMIVNFENFEEMLLSLIAMLLLL